MEITIETSRCAEHVDRLRALVDEALPALVPRQEPASLYEPVRYVLAGQGKRVRPLLLLLAAEVFGVEARRALPAALAAEVFHNFTLVHDDIVDNAEARRGRPTVHVAWSADTAILCGDYLMGLSYELLARTETPRLLQVMQVFSEMMTRLCEGQSLDKDFERRDAVSVADYLTMIDGKTGALLRACAEVGGVIGGASDAQRATLRAFGEEVGRAFQVQDDLLDLMAEDDRWGKTIGGDLMEGKKTLLLLEALERAQGAEYAWFARIHHHDGLPAGEIDEARTRMHHLGVIDKARAAVLHHTSAALEHLEALPQGEAVDTLCWLIRQMQARVH